MVWVLLTAFSQIYSENWEQKGEQKDLENLYLGEKGVLCEGVAKMGAVANEISTYKKQPSALH